MPISSSERDFKKIRKKATEEWYKQPRRTVFVPAFGCRCDKYPFEHFHEGAWGHSLSEVSMKAGLYQDAE